MTRLKLMMLLRCVFWGAQFFFLRTRSNGMTQSLQRRTLFLSAMISGARYVYREGAKGFNDH
jgi:hypothetical protein